MASLVQLNGKLRQVSGTSTYKVDGQKFVCFESTGTNKGEAGFHFNAGAFMNDDEYPTNYDKVKSIFDREDIIVMEKEFYMRYINEIIKYLDNYPDESDRIKTNLNATDTGKTIECRNETKDLYELSFEDLDTSFSTCEGKVKVRENGNPIDGKVTAETNKKDYEVLKQSGVYTTTASYGYESDVSVNVLEGYKCVVKVEYDDKVAEELYDPCNEGDLEFEFGSETCATTVNLRDHNGDELEGKVTAENTSDGTFVVKNKSFNGSIDLQLPKDEEYKITVDSHSKTSNKYAVGCEDDSIDFEIDTSDIETCKQKFEIRDKDDNLVYNKIIRLGVGTDYSEVFDDYQHRSSPEIELELQKDVDYIVKAAVEDEDSQEENFTACSDTIVFNFDVSTTTDEYCTMEFNTFDQNDEPLKCNMHYSGKVKKSDGSTVTGYNFVTEDGHASIEVLEGESEVTVTAQSGTVSEEKNVSPCSDSPVDFQLDVSPSETCTQKIKVLDNDGNLARAELDISGWSSNVEIDGTYTAMFNSGEEIDLTVKLVDTGDTIDDKFIACTGDEIIYDFSSQQKCSETISLKNANNNEPLNGDVTVSNQTKTTTNGTVTFKDLTCGSTYEADAVVEVDGETYTESKSFTADDGTTTIQFDISVKDTCKQEFNLINTTTGEPLSGHIEIDGQTVDMPDGNGSIELNTGEEYTAEAVLDNYDETNSKTFTACDSDGITFEFSIDVTCVVTFEIIDDNTGEFVEGELDIDGEGTFDTSGGTKNIDLTCDKEYTVKAIVTKNGNEYTDTKTFNAEENQTVTLEVSIPQETCSQTMKIVDQNGNGLDGIIELEGEEIDTTGGSVTFTGLIKGDEYTATSTFDDETKEKTFTACTGDTLEFTYQVIEECEQEFVLQNQNDEPLEGTVTVDGSSGDTSNGSVVFENLVVGDQYTAKAKYNGESKSKNFTACTGSPIVFNFEVTEHCTQEIQVVDHNDNGISDVPVTIDDNTQETDSDGFVEFDNLVVGDTYEALIEFEEISKTKSFTACQGLITVELNITCEQVFRIEDINGNTVDGTIEVEGENFDTENGEKKVEFNTGIDTVATANVDGNKMSIPFKTCQKEPILFKFDMEAEPAPIPDAIVEVDGEQVGKTDSSGNIIIDDITEGEHEICVRKTTDGKVCYSENCIKIDMNKNTSENVVLNRVLYYLTINTENYTDIIANDYYRGRSDSSGKFELFVTCPSESLKLVARKEGVGTHQTTVTVTEDMSINMPL